jgi:hypothetical protein
MNLLFTKHKLSSLISWLSAAIVFIFIGCDKFQGEQTIPSYIHVDSLSFVTEYATQGTVEQNFVDVWVYVDDDLIGGFEVPATIPILSEGIHRLDLRPGIKLNGISDTRAPYPCITPVIIEEFELIKDSVIPVTGTSEYYGNAVFVWMEDFEDASLAIHSTSSSDTNIARTSPAGAPGAFLNAESQYSGICHLDKNRDFLELVSDDGNGQGFVIDRGDFVFLEIHYRTDVPILVGLYISLSDNTVQDRAFIVINSSDTWNKIYVNFTPVVNETLDAENFKIYLQAQLGTMETSAEVLLDNIKLVTRPNL